MDSPCTLPPPSLHTHRHFPGESPRSLNGWTGISDASLPPQFADHHVAEEDEGRRHRHSHPHSPARGRALNGQASRLSLTSDALRRDKLSSLPKSPLKQSSTPEPDTPGSPYLPPGGHQRHHENHHHDHGHNHSHHHGHSHDHDHSVGHEKKNASRSLFTRSLLAYTARFPMIHAILIERDSRRIFYFMALNFGFMTVQAFYGYLTDSLGLLSDSIHMFFDCVALLVGLLAAVMSKWPPSQRFPHGFGNVETLSGFANGILLMLLSVEIAFEAFERLWEGTQTKRLGELLVVSSLGLAVNLIGMMSFGHHHHHGHDHVHAHGHVEKHSDSHSHDEKHHGCGSHGHGHGHGHVHDNENMYGIYLHVMADTLGSVSVIVSTILTSIWGWSGWDPLASCLIAGLIFASAVPLVLSSAKKLLLTIPEGVEYNLRSTLAGIGQQRGVVTYSTPKFWMDDGAGDKLVGVVHVTAAREASLEDTKDRVREYLRREGVDAVVQVEREGDYGCWCARTRRYSMAPQDKEDVDSFGLLRS